MTRQLYYRGFIDACASCGLKKEAADALYKEAGLGIGLGLFFGTADRLGRVVARTGVNLAKGTAKATGKLLRAGGNRLLSGARWLGSGTASTYREFARDFAREFAAAGGKVPSFPRTTKILKGLGGAALSPTQTTYNFIKKHPVISTIGGIGLGAYLGNPVDLDDRESVERMRMRTLTPSEKIMYDRYANGLGLPGLGLDPMYFNSSDPNSLLQYLRY